MAKLAYFDCPTGIAGDMCLGALVHAGVPLEYLRDRLAGLGLSDEYTLQAETVQRRGQAATQVQVRVNPIPPQPARHLPEIEHLILKAGLPTRARDWSLHVFRALAEAEAAVHGQPVEHVHFHEVGATDALVDIVGTCLGLDWLGIEAFDCSALPTGGGTVQTAHGLLPVPVPAVLQLWRRRQVPVYANGLERELVTPTGAALMVALARRFGPPPPLRLQTIGLGAGTAALPLPNVVRLWIGESLESKGDDTDIDTVTVIETQIDDQSPQGLAYAMEQLFQAGALDVWGQAIAMKKSRLGTLLTVLCPPDRAAACEAVLFRETTTLGLRVRQQERHVLRRESRTVNTPYGPVAVKLGYWQDKVVNIQPEFEDCARWARQHGEPLSRIQAAASAKLREEL